MGKQAAEKTVPTAEELVERADENRTVEVVAAIDGVYDNGVKYAKGETFRMAVALVPPHIRAGQVELAKQK